MDIKVKANHVILVHNNASLSLLNECSQIGQMAFRGMKQLNLIQSVVYQAAYTTNENLLICAPTGAGKTNIAMLTILHEIKQHLAQGVIKKDEFKVRTPTAERCSEHDCNSNAQSWISI